MQITKIIQFTFHSFYMHMHLVLPEQWKHCTKLTQLVLFHSWHVPFLPTLYLRATDNQVRTDRKRNHGFPHPSLSSSYHSHPSGCLIPESHLSKNRYDKVLLHALECYCFLPVLKTSSSESRKCGFLRLSSPPLPTYTHSPLTHLEPHWTPRSVELPEFCAHGHHKHCALVG